MADNFRIVVALDNVANLNTRHVRRASFPGQLVAYALARFQPTQAGWGAQFGEIGWPASAAQVEAAMVTPPRTASRAMFMNKLGHLTAKALRVCCFAGRSSGGRAECTYHVKRETPALTESAMTHAVLHRPRPREKSGPISHRHGNLRVGTLRKIYGHSFAAGQPLDTTLYELLELPGSHNVSDLHLAMLQQDYDDGLLERKVKKVICRK